MCDDAEKEGVWQARGVCDDTKGVAGLGLPHPSLCIPLSGVIMLLFTLSRCLC